MTTENEAEQGTVQGPEGWRPEPNDVIKGKIVDIDEATSTQADNNGNYRTYPLLLIEKEGDGSHVYVHCFHQTLMRPILQRRPEIGHRIAIKFHGKKSLKSNSSRSVAIYSIDLPDTPKNMGSIYDRIERQTGARGPQQQQQPQQSGSFEPMDPDADFGW